MAITYRHTDPPAATALAKPERRPTVVELRKVSCAYEVGRPAISDISFSVREGEILCLLGPS